MATNLVSEIAEVLSPNIVSNIATALGLNRTATQKAVVAGVPALLAALISYVSKPQGAAKLTEVVRKQEPGVLASLASVIGEPGQKALIDQGGSVLTALLGGKTLSALTGAVTQYAGTDAGGSKSLMGLLGPVVLGVLGREQRDRGLDASGLANFLTSQKSNVTGALPSGFSKYLADTGILDGISTSGTKYASRAPATPPSILPWLLGALAVLAIGWWFGIFYPDATSNSSIRLSHRSERPRPRRAKRLTLGCSLNCRVSRPVIPTLVGSTIGGQPFVLFADGDQG